MQIEALNELEQLIIDFIFLHFICCDFSFSICLNLCYVNFISYHVFCGVGKALNMTCMMVI